MGGPSQFTDSVSTMTRLRFVGFAIAWMVCSGSATAQDDRLEILCVQAHHDDEVTYSATLYAVTRFLDGEVDVAILTDGSGGFDYSMLAEPIYGKTLAREPEARTFLPAVRKREMLAGAEILGLRNVFFLDALDHMYTQDVDTVIHHVWDFDDLVRRVEEIMSKREYDFVFTLLPMDFQHGHHKAATIAALTAASRSEHSPVVIGGLPTTPTAADTLTYGGLEGYPITATTSGGPTYQFDRRKPLESDSLLNYHVIVNWHIAEHKSQGTLQNLVNEWDLENFWIYSTNPDDAQEKTRRLFERLNAIVPWEAR